MLSPKLLLTAAILLVSLQLSAQTYVSGVISTNTSWTSTGSPYIISDSLIIDESAILNVDAGTVVMFRYHPDPGKKTYMVVNGGIRTFGSASNPVVFTSDRDDSLGDLNGDGKASIARPGDWGFIALNSPDPTEQEYGFHETEFRYGGGRNPDSIASPELYPMLTFREEILIGTDRMYVSYCRFSHSKGSAIRMGYASLWQASISNCSHGILLTSSNGGLHNSIIEKNAGYPILFNDMTMNYNHQLDGEGSIFFMEGFSGNTMQDNGLNYFAIGGNVDATIEGTASPVSVPLNWKKLPIPYLVTDPLILNGMYTLVEKGALVKFKYYPEENRKPYILMDSLSVLHTSGLYDGDPLVFTSEYDHRYDYEPFEGKHPNPRSGDWGYIEGSDFSLQDCVIKYGGVYVNPSTGKVAKDSSAVIRLRAGSLQYLEISNSLFNSLYRDAIMFLFDPDASHEITIDSNSFLLTKDAYGIKWVESGSPGSWSIDARNNYWYGKLGPFNADSNLTGNGCRIADKIKFKPFLTSSDDELELVSSVVRGVAKNLDGEILNNALIKLKGKKEKTVFSKSDGSYYMSNIYPGYGYEMQAFAARHFDTVYNNMVVEKDTTHFVDVYLRARTIDYLVDTITFKVNPEVSEVQVGGTCYRYYKVIDRKSHDPVFGAEVFVEGLVDTFYTSWDGIVVIPVSWDEIGYYPSSKNYYIKKIGIETLEYPPEMRMHFKVRTAPRDYEKMWGGKLWLKEGISIVEFKQEAGADIGLLIEDQGSGEVAQKLLLGRGFKAGAGINLGVSAKATLGPLEAGAEAEVGVNLNAFMEDRFVFDYETTGGEMALAKFLVLAGSAFQHLDSPLHRYLGIALLDDNPYVAMASYSNSVGLNYSGYAGADASIGINFTDSEGKESPIGAEMKGSAEAEGNIDFTFTNYTQSPQLDFELAWACEIGLGVSAGVGFDIAKLFGGGDEKDKNDKNSADPNKKKDDDDGFEIEIPDLLSIGASAGIKYGASIGTYRNIPEPYTSLGFMYGYKYSAGVDAFSLFGAGVGEDREYNFAFDFRDDYLIDIIEDKVQLAKDIANTDPANLSLDISSLSGGNIFSSPFAAFAAEQTKNAFSFPAIPYNHTITDLHDEGEFAVEISFGLGPVKCKFGGGIEYTEVNDYLWKSGVFYNWGLYPLQSYDYIADNDAFDVGPILQDILFESGEYLWEAIKDELIPPIFKKIPIWPFTLLKSGGEFIIPVGPDSRTSFLAVDTLSTADSLFCYYWDWYGTEGIPAKKSGMPAEDLAILEHIKSKAVELHKLDYGIGGFYQFEPNGRVIADSAVLTINYSDEELLVLLPDSSEYNIDEFNLRMYAEDKSNTRWIYIGGQVDTAANTVTARIDSLGTFTLAPFIPDGEIVLTASPDTIFVETSNSTMVSSNTIYYNTGEVVADGEEFTIAASKGSVDTTDANTEIEGIQVLSSGGTISFEYMSDSISGAAYLKATSRMGGAVGMVRVAIFEENAPEAPVLNTVELNDYQVELDWDASPDIDVAGYMVYFGTSSGAPYEGTASVLGENSPVNVGATTLSSLGGLYKDSTYYFAIRAIDRCGNVSDYSNEMVLDTRFNHAPVIYSRVITIDNGLPQGTVIDTVWASDEDRDQNLFFYLTEQNTSTAFSLGAITGEIRVQDAAQVDYVSTGVDSFLIHVGVRDTGPNPLRDSTSILIVIDISSGVRRTLHPDETRFRMYPNPATDELNIELTGTVNLEEVRIGIINMQGQMIRREIRKGAGRNKVQIDLNGIPPGLYSVTVQTDSGRGVQRLVLMR